MVANRGIHTHAIDHVAIGLEVGEEPIVILVARVAHRDAEKLLACVNIVSRGQDEAQVVLIERCLERIRHLLLSAILRFLPGSDSEVTDDGERERRRRRVGFRIGAKSIVISSGFHERLLCRRPVPPDSLSPLLVLDDDPV